MLHNIGMALEGKMRINIYSIKYQVVKQVRTPENKLVK